MMNKLKYLFRAYRYRFLLDTAEIGFILKHLRPGDIAVDIGCHKGGYLYWMRKKVGSTGKIYAFEPQKILYAYLQETIKTVGYNNVVVENKGVSDKAGTVHFYIPATKSGTSPGARVDSDESTADFQQTEIEVVSLDSYFLEQEVFPKLIKIDVEGHEKQVLQGGLQLLKKCKPALVMECESRHQGGGDIFDVFNILLGIGYKGYFFENGELQPLEKFRPEIHQASGEGRFWQEKGYINNFIFDTD